MSLHINKALLIGKNLRKISLCFIQIHQALLAVVILVIFMPIHVFASINCSTPPNCTSSNAIFSIGGSFLINDMGTFSNGFDTTRLTSTNEIKIYVGGNSSIKNLPYKNLEKIFIGDASFASNIDAKFFGSLIDPNNLILDGSFNRSVGVSQLNLDHVNLHTDARLSFEGSDNQINLRDSNITFGGSHPIFMSTAPLTINVDSGSNYFQGFEGEHNPTSTAINMQPGTSLRFYYSGDMFANYNPDKLYFNTPVTGNINNATMTFQLSNVYFNSTNFAFTNNSTLELTGSETKAEFEHLLIDTSQINLGRNTTLTVRDLNLANSTITLASGGKLDVDVATIKDTTTLTGSDLAGTGLYARGLNIEDSITFNHNGSIVRADNVIVGSDSQLNINNGKFYARATTMNGGTANITITNGGQYQIDSGFSIHGRDGTFNVDNTSSLRIATTGGLFLGPDLHINNNGTVYADGNILGQGTISGTGQTVVGETGQVSPGHSNSFGHLISTILIENSTVFTNRGIFGNQSQSQIYAHLDVVGGTEKNDLIQYNDRSFDITGLTSIKVDMANKRTASDMHGKAFTIVASLNGGSSGAILNTSGSDPVIVEGSNIPALIDFTITDANTNGHNDITLNATNLGAPALLTHPSVTSPNQTGISHLLIHGSNNNNTAINTALNTLTNSQVASHTSSIHPEPYSSNLTVSLEQNDLILDMVLNNSGLVNHTSSFTGLNGGSLIEPETQRRFWFDSSYVEGNVDGDGHLGDFEYNLTSLVFGTDLVSTETSNFGVFFGVGYQEMDEHDMASQDFSGTGYHIGGYGFLGRGAWDIRGAIGYGYGDLESKRFSQLGTTLSGYNKADFDSHNVYAGIKAHYTEFYASDLVTVIPTVSLLYSYHKQDDIKEKGVSDLALYIDSASAESIITGVGVEFTFKSFGAKKLVTPVLFVRYEKDWEADNNDAHEVTASLVSHPDHKRDFTGQNRGADIWTLGLGLTGNISSNLQLSGGIVAGWNSNGDELAYGFNALYRF